MRTTLIATAVLAFCSACAAGERSVSRQTGDGGVSNGSQAASDSGGVAIGRELPTLLQFTLQGLLDGAGDSVVVLDLDGDDVRDTLSFATVRAGVMASAWISGRGDVSSDAICERYGVLRTRTGGVRDLACNGNLVLRYDAALSRWK